MIPIILSSQITCPHCGVGDMNVQVDIVNGPDNLSYFNSTCEACGNDVDVDRQALWDAITQARRADSE